MSSSRTFEVVVTGLGLAALGGGAVVTVTEVATAPGWLTFLIYFSFFGYPLYSTPGGQALLLLLCGGGCCFPIVLLILGVCLIAWKRN